MKSLCLATLIAGAVALSVSPAMAHHSHAMFDHTKFQSVTGTVKSFAFVNPHGELDVMVADASGKQVKYWFEMSNLSNMVARGIGKNTFKVGDKVKVTYHPLKDGRPGGNYTAVLAPDGKTYE